MKRLPIILLMLVSLSGFGQIQSIHTLVGSNNPNSALTKRGLDGSLSWTASGTNIYTVNIGLGVTALTDGDIIKVHIPNANSSTTVTLNVNSIGAIAVKDNAGSDPAVGDIKAGGTYILRYNGTHFRVLNLGGGGGVSVVSGTTNRITSTGGATPVIDISATFEALLSKVAQRIDQNNASTTSAQLATTLSDETGTGVVVYSASPALTGTPTAPTASANNNSTQIATTAYVDAAIAILNNLITIVTIPEVSITTTGGTITLDFSVSSVARQEVFFRGSTSFNSTKTVSITNTTNARKFSFEIDATSSAAVLTFTGSDSADDVWDESADTWTAPGAGKFTIHAEKINSVWSISGWGPRL